ncbi:MFS transporter [Orrella daihaiensis]|uniref:MFS transporter n=1 Tax=Orrella daihaiensis TaxID=2782176 RepID=A0ABY4AID7_9BURK|nr:MFS transporter [Orrella daihaiensis]UOD50055.1 MFS transporter [Orrella daihaiensis]
MNVLRSNPIAIIVIAQLFGTSLWFSPNSAAESLMLQWGLSTAQLGQLTSATQFGFIAGTLLLATTGLADRFAASRICALSCLTGACFNALFALTATGFDQGLVWRFLVGVTIAGIYPLGMKMIISWSTQNTGNTLGMLVAMLTLGSALPHGVRAAGIGWAWESVVLTSTALALMAAVMVYLLGDGPNLPKAQRQAASAGLARWGAALKVFLDPKFRASASGYFGHMWELYAFWTLLPFLVADVVLSATSTPSSAMTSALTFVVMGVMGAIGAVTAGRLSRHLGSPRVAAVALLSSGLMCLTYPFIPDSLWVIKALVLIIWGLTVVSDSAQFSATSAKLCPPNLVGGALAIQNSIGFFISTVSIMLVMALYESAGSAVVWYLLPGPVLGLLLFKRLLTAKDL